MTIQELKSMSRHEVLNFVRKRLAFDDSVAISCRNSNYEHEHLRFDMSGYETKTGQCTVHNQMVLNRFADLGIYDYSGALFLDFYKGGVKLYIAPMVMDDNVVTYDLTNLGTTEIIYEIFKLTIFSQEKTARRR